MSSFIIYGLFTLNALLLAKGQMRNRIAQTDLKKAI